MPMDSVKWHMLQQNIIVGLDISGSYQAFDWQRRRKLICHSPEKSCVVSHRVGMFHAQL